MEIAIRVVGFKFRTRQAGMEMDYEIYHLGDVALQSGTVLADAKLAYKTHGVLNAARDNVIVIPTY